MDFEAAVLKRDGPKVVRPVGALFFREKDNVGLVYGTQVRREAMKVSERVKESRFDRIPVALVKSRPKTVGTWAGVIIHREEGGANFFDGERTDDGGGLG
jgi:hypothetical protein